MYPQLVEREGLDLPLKRPSGFESQAHLSLEVLLERRLFVDIVEKSTLLIKDATEPSTYEQLDSLLEIWLLRFKALLVLRQGSIVAHEAQTRMANLDELPASEPVWGLRILLVPVWTKGINQSAIQQVYQLAVEARTQMMQLSNDEVWPKRLRALGLQVASYLVGMRDYLGAIQYLISIYSGEKHAKDDYATVVGQHIAVCYMHLGDAEAARHWDPTCSEWLLAFTAGDYSEIAASPLENDDGVSVASLKALSNLQVGNVQNCIQILESALTRLPSSTLLFNLFMTFDLVANNSAAHKTEFAGKMLQHFDALPSYELLV